MGRDDDREECDGAPEGAGKWKARVHGRTGSLAALTFGIRTRSAKGSYSDETVKSRSIFFRVASTGTGGAKGRSGAALTAAITSRASEPARMEATSEVSRC